MTKHIISMLTLLVVSLIAVMTLLYETRESGHLTTFGYAVAILTAISFVLGVAAEVHTMREEAREEAEERAKELAQKQQLGRIETEMKASVRPLLPIALFYTIRHTAKAEELDHAFAHVRGFKSIKNEFLKLVGSARLGGRLGYNSITLSATESHSTLEGQDLSTRIEKQTGFVETAIRHPVGIFLDFFFSSDGKLPQEPSLSLEKAFTTGKPDEVNRIELLDTELFQDSIVREWTAQTQTGQNWSVADLFNARLRLRLEFLGERGPASLHDLQIFFGPSSASHGLRFPTEMLAAAVFKPNESPLLTPTNDLAKQFFASYILEYECVLSETIMKEQFVKLVTR